MPLPSLGGFGTALGGLANVLGLGLEGYAKDEATRVERERQRQQDLNQAAMLKVQMDEHQANVEDRKAATALKQQKATAGHKAFLQLAQEYPNHPDVLAGEIEGGDYSKVLTDARAQAKVDKDKDVKGRALFKALGDTFGNDPNVQRFMQGGYSAEKVDAIGDVWDQASKRYQLVNAYHPPQPRAPRYVVAHDNTTNTDVYVSAEQAAAMPDRYTKPAGTAGRGGAGAISPESTQAMFDSAESASKYMDWYEKNHPNGPGWISGGVGSSSIQPRKGLGSSLAAGAANIALGVFDPQYQTYLAAQRRFGNVFSNLQSRRYTEHQSVLDTDLSGMNPGEAANTIALKKQFRQDLLNSRPAPPADYKRQTSNEFQTPDDTVFGGSTSPSASTSAPSFNNSLTPAAPRPTTAAPAAPTAAPKTSSTGTLDYSTMSKGQLWDQSVRENGIKFTIQHFGSRAQYVASP